MTGRTVLPPVEQGHKLEIELVPTLPPHTEVVSAMERVKKQDNAQTVPAVIKVMKMSCVRSFSSIFRVR